MVPENEKVIGGEAVASSLSELKAQNPQKRPAKPQPPRDEALRQLPKYPVRVRFSKKGRMKYISHLDLLRTMHSAMMRAGVPVWFTEGFNPRAKMVFSLPLSLFVESECEFMDIKLLRDCDLEALRARLDAAFTDDLTVLEVYKPDSKFTDIGWAKYRIEIEHSALRAADMDALLAGEMTVIKKTKSGEKPVDIRPLIRDCVSSDTDGGFVCEATLRATSADFLNPEYLIKALTERTGEVIEDYGITRIEVLCEDGGAFR